MVWDRIRCVAGLHVVGQQRGEAPQCAPAAAQSSSRGQPYPTPKPVARFATAFGAPAVLAFSTRLLKYCKPAWHTYVHAYLLQEQMPYIRQGLCNPLPRHVSVLASNRRDGTSRNKRRQKTLKDVALKKPARNR
eukprot:361816-Chlamydomonas_euryale.AAC.6